MVITNKFYACLFLSLFMSGNTHSESEDGKESETQTKPQVYKSVDKSGKVTFSDQLDNNATPIQIKEPNTLQPVTAKARKPIQPAPKHIKGYQSIAISQPTSGSTIANSLIPFEVTIQLKPNLKPNHQLQLLIDGKVYATGSNTMITVSGLHRGQHTLIANVVDNQGTLLKASSPIFLFARRPSSN